VVVNYGRFLDGGRHDASWKSPPSSKQPAARRVGKSDFGDMPVHAGPAPPGVPPLCRERRGLREDIHRFRTGGATPGAVKTMLEAVDGEAQVKASGGIKTHADAARYLDLGCTRLGSSTYLGLLP